MIVEIAGRPAEHVKEALAKHLGALNDVKDVEVHTLKVSEPAPIDGSEGLFTCFGEADFEVGTFGRLSEIMFDFMPSSVEVIEPPRISMDTSEATGLLNNLSGRLHRYDELAKVANFRVKQLSAELQAAQKAPEKKKTGSARSTPSAAGAKKAAKKAAKKKVAKKKK